MSKHEKRSQNVRFFQSQIEARNVLHALIILCNCRACLFSLPCRWQLKHKIDANVSTVATARLLFTELSKNYRTRGLSITFVCRDYSNPTIPGSLVLHHPAPARVLLRIRAARADVHRHYVVYYRYGISLSIVDRLLWQVTLQE